jgi:hypothetical protein
MPRGYMEGPASEEAEQRADELARGVLPGDPLPQYPAVYGSTDDDPESHFLGWANEVDPDELFASGKAWGISIRRVAATDTGTG